MFGIPEEEERERRTKEIFETIMAENFPKLIRLKLMTKPQIQETQRIPPSINNKSIHLGISYSNCRKSETRRKS